MRRLAFLLAAVAAGCGPDSSGGACKDNLVAGDLVITEVFADFAAPAGGTGTDDGKEWFEIYNNADRPISLKGMTIVSSKIDGSKPSTHTMTDVTVAPGQYFTLGNATSDLVPAYVDYGYSADLGQFANTGGGKLALKCGDSEIDSATYDTVKSGHSRQFSNSGPPDYTANDDLANWCEAKDTEFESGNFGTPGEENDCAPVIEGACMDTSGMRPVVTPAVGDLVITEVMPKPSAVGATVGQWVEIKAINDLDLNGLSLDRANDSSNPSVISSPSCLHVAAGTYAVFARSTDSSMNGGITAIATLPFSINPTSNADVQILNGTTVLDAISWATSTSGKSRSLDPQFTTISGNDDQANFCDGVMPYNTTGGTDRGTPGAANETCPMVAPAGMCYEGANLRAIVKPVGTALVINEYLANPKGTTAGVDAAQEWFEVTNVGAASFDLNDLLVRGTSDTTSSQIQSSNCIPVPKDGFAVVAHNNNATLNGGLPKVDATWSSSISLGNTTGRLQILDGTTVLDTLSWTTTATGAPDGISMQLDPAHRDATSNDAPATNYFTLAACPGLTTYGTAGNKGTPGAANTCPP